MGGDFEFQVQDTYFLEIWKINHNFWNEATFTYWSQMSLPGSNTPPPPPIPKGLTPGPLTKSRLTFFGVHSGNFHHWSLLSFPWWRGSFLKLIITFWYLLSYCLYPGPPNSPVSKRVNPCPLTKSRLTFFGVHRGNFHHWRLLSFPWWRGLFLKLLINTGSITSSCTTFVIGTLPLEHQQWVVGCTVGDNCTIFFLTKKCLKDFC